MICPTHFSMTFCCIFEIACLGPAVVRGRIIVLLLLIPGACCRAHLWGIGLTREDFHGLQPSRKWKMSCNLICRNSKRRTSVVFASMFVSREPASKVFPYYSNWKRSVMGRRQGLILKNREKVNLHQNDFGTQT